MNEWIEMEECLDKKKKSKDNFLLIWISRKDSE